ncbi:MAG TPA: ribonuclease D, partial [Thermopetrobacter sp.]|nr:ribonuclease D [Thermopetrobacter sp.]
NVLKVFHAGRQDIEIFHHLAAVIPHPLFDTQIAAMVCGFGDQVGYEQLVNRLAKASIDKSSRFTDWARRPLTEQQLSYAIADVTHLRVIFEKLCGMIRRSGREPWLKEEMDILASPATYAQHPEDAWKRLKARLRKPRQLAALRALAAWREREAQARDMPRRRVLKDEALIELATQLPADERQLAALRSISPGQARSATGRALLKVIAEVQALPEDALPQPARGKPQPPEGAGAKADILKLALKIVSERERIAPKLIAPAADLERIAAGETDVPALQGWRRAVFGDLAQKLLAGQMVIGIQDGKPAIMPS